MRTSFPPLLHSQDIHFPSYSKIDSTPCIAKIGALADAFSDGEPPLDRLVLKGEGVLANFDPALSDEKNCLYAFDAGRTAVVFLHDAERKYALALHLDNKDEKWNYDSMTAALIAMRLKGSLFQDIRATIVGGKITNPHHIGHHINLALRHANIAPTWRPQPPAQLSRAGAILDVVTGDIKRFIHPASLVRRHCHAKFVELNTRITSISKKNLLRDIKDLDQGHFSKSDIRLMRFMFRRDLLDLPANQDGSPHILRMHFCSLNRAPIADLDA